jgi:hypothetical protein
MSAATVDRPSSVDVARLDPYQFMAIMARVMSRPAYLRKMAWLMPRIQRAVPYLGFIAVCGTKPTSATT